jgi:hypothetical protein
VNPARLNYYEKAMKAMLEGDMPIAALWPLLQTWTLSVEALGEASQREWLEVCSHLQLSNQGFVEKVAALDRFIDEIEIYLDELATANGLETSTSL